MAGKSFSESIGQFTLFRNSPLRQHAPGLRSRGLLSRQSPITVIGDGGIINCSVKKNAICDLAFTVAAPSISFWQPRNTSTELLC